MKKYAPFFEWPEKNRKELGIVENLIESLNKNINQYHSPESYKNDPPDCICRNETGELVAIEVSEVVCEDAARENSQGNDVYRVWRFGELTEHIAQRLIEKDKKTYDGGPYAEMVICLFTDEPSLRLEEITHELDTHNFGHFTQITSGYLMFSYNAHKKTYPVLKLNIIHRG